jgi:hypothetical protein
VRGEKFSDLDADKSTLEPNDEVRGVSLLSNLGWQRSGLEKPLQQKPLALFLSMCRAHVHDAQ